MTDLSEADKRELKADAMEYIADIIAEKTIKYAKPFRLLAIIRHAPPGAIDQAEFKSRNIRDLAKNTLLYWLYIEL